MANIKIVCMFATTRNRASLTCAVATLDFPDAEQCFENFKAYWVKLRRPTDPTAKIEFELSYR